MSQHVSTVCRSGHHGRLQIQSLEIRVSSPAQIAIYTTVKLCLNLSAVFNFLVSLNSAQLLALLLDTQFTPKKKLNGMTQSFYEIGYIKKEALAQVFSCKFCEISKKIFSTEHFWATASGVNENR